MNITDTTSKTSIEKGMPNVYKKWAKRSEK